MIGGTARRAGKMASRLLNSSRRSCASVLRTSNAPAAATQRINDSSSGSSAYNWIYAALATGCFGMGASLSYCDPGDDGDDDPLDGLDDLDRDTAAMDEEIKKQDEQRQSEQQQRGAAGGRARRGRRRTKEEQARIDEELRAMAQMAGPGGEQGQMADMMAMQQLTMGGVRGGKTKAQQLAEDMKAAEEATSTDGGEEEEDEEARKKKEQEELLRQMDPAGVISFQDLWHQTAIDTLPSDCLTMVMQVAGKQMGAMEPEQGAANLMVALRGGFAPPAEPGADVMSLQPILVAADGPNTIRMPVQFIGQGKYVLMPELSIEGSHTAVGINAQVMPPRGAPSSGMNPQQQAMMAMQPSGVVQLGMSASVKSTDDCVVDFSTTLSKSQAGEDEHQISYFQAITEQLALGGVLTIRGGNLLEGQSSEAPATLLGAHGSYMDDAQKNTIMARYHPHEKYPFAVRYLHTLKNDATVLSQWLLQEDMSSTLVLKTEVPLRVIPPHMGGNGEPYTSLRTVVNSDYDFGAKIHHKLMSLDAQGFVDVGAAVNFVKNTYRFGVFVQVAG